MSDCATSCFLGLPQLGGEGAECSHPHTAVQLGVAGSAGLSVSVLGRKEVPHLVMTGAYRGFSRAAVPEWGFRRGTTGISAFPLVWPWDAYLRLLIFLLAILIPACVSSSPAFLMMYSAYKLNKQGDNIQP